MSAWTKDELNRIGKAEELEIAPARGNGTLRKAVPIWVVRVGDDLYVRSYKGHDGLWFRTARATHEGHIRAGGVDKDVIFIEELDPRINDQIDAVYRSKYRHLSQYVPPMVSDEVRSTTLKLVPRAASKST